MSANRNRELCRKCRHRFNPEEGFVGIHFSEGKTAADQLRNGTVVFLCAGCADPLRAYLNLPIVPEERR